MNRVKPQELPQAPKGLNPQNPTLPEAIIRTIPARIRAYLAELKYNRAKTYLAGEASKIGAWTLRLECNPLPGYRAGSLCVRRVYDTSDMDIYGRSEFYTEVICGGDSNTWYCLEATDEMEIINVVKITPARAEELLSKVNSAEATVAAYETALQALANKTNAFDQGEKQRVDDFQP